MKRSRFSEEQIIGILKEAGVTIPRAVFQASVLILAPFCRFSPSFSYLLSDYYRTLF